MDPYGLLVFREVAHAGSISGASRVLHVTQPAVTHHVRSLERSAGVPLLLRRPRGVSLTEAGQQLLLRADEVARSLDLADRQMAALRRAETGLVRVVAFPSACATIVPAAVAGLRRSFPGIVMTVDVLEPPAALAALLQGDADVALRYDFSEVPTPALAPGLVTVPLLTDPLHVVLSVDHPLAGRRRLSLLDLPDDEWIVSHDRGREQLEALAALSGTSVRIAFVTDDYVAMQAMAAAGRAVAVLNALPLAAVRLPGISAPVFQPVSRRSISLCHHADAAGLPAIAHTLAALDSAAEQYRRDL